MVRKGRPRDCNDIPDWCPNGVYKVYPRHTTGFEVYCEMKIDGGHWTVFQRRENGYVDFLRGWNDYKHGFGYLKHEFWLGNKKMHSLTSHGQYEMRIDLTDFEGNDAFAKYKHFKIGAESTKFKLTANGYYGTAGNSLEHHNGFSFSTRDQDNDNAPSGNCSTWFPCGWWYNRCVTANLNGVYFIRTPDKEHRVSNDIFTLFWNKNTFQDEHLCYNKTTERLDVCCNNYEWADGKCNKCKLGTTTEAGGRCSSCQNDLYGEKCSQRCSCDQTERCDAKVGCISNTNTTKKHTTGSTLNASPNKRISTKATIGLKNVDRREDQ
ncbi:Ficolin-1-A,Angiopoietin-1,Fibrinogen C domain-containing protein 1,Ryncolin-1,Tenascin-N,Angiopoietin-related protein 7,Angiopoietin-related protein 6,Ficolin-3,Fibrinogen C domain-containing protein 1-B,Fibroleukin,Fibrinogen-like protein 1,Ficolin-1,Ficolin-1-B,Angiopoietin-4,Tenascin-R,Ryncolin-2,Fibrinogen C domain-containing protein 1-A,Microfibril-associated glycoprotein 4,Fibrinogen-like protein A,Ryncolin-3,Fibrinogen gamma chain,Angiopoietin-2,Tenascin-X,Ficolin-2,Tenascin,Angiopoietin-related pr|uniref:Fibrinogen C-terminal domain-containing protein n=1 Tax=Mytilus edulis TaxID=6550 RepID=A0A8S3TII4_MYTED|nr:Ficolin-1-A,Angiopoietin-1,Fibrinogen C domain-containing protein 1,Ryncolin-1,Tenascin-N,Angiopoietin-related protein 7,Angiopoietin-related protein 6,Ficolin-3,Fibrinogen C domain-containing protein 1-B,Fibroleukin,Fibrinogen-like protein 1,Ficolin-1,Ficolin-1-B,Angiopoietin-4,Tenascin-R,Ryncolin-2,Fibrinogen C domain-containing protein 1-A,Microfibril-associated glycoprotein 4,Fibrinogen-like protein A,Ryncolin-3,Fibrinogen gamma chain,Angiopoietin-2,Tenascin-X,Ficolin-2,Tenascin,Angiopoietin